MADIASRLPGARVQAAGRHGKYFWLRLQADRPMVMLMHFGMTGMVRLRGVTLHLVFMENGGDKKVRKGEEEEVKEEVKEVGDIVEEEVNREVGEAKREEETNGETELALRPLARIKHNHEWPPRFSKLEMEFEQNGSVLQMAFTDPRRLARVRFLEGPEVATDALLLLAKPLADLGPDYSKPSDLSVVDALPLSKAFVFGDPDPDHHGRPRPLFDEFARMVLSKKKPVKALLLDQDKFAGVGNWVADEVLFHARLHPAEVLHKKISDPASPVLRRLYDAIIYITEEAVRVEGDVRRFPKHWLMMYRWGKGRGGPKATTKEGHKVDFQTVGGRTSCYIPALQRPLRKDSEGQGPEGPEGPQGPEEAIKEVKEEKEAIKEEEEEKVQKMENEDSTEEKPVRGKRGTRGKGGTTGKVGTGGTPSKARGTAKRQKR